MPGSPTGDRRSTQVVAQLFAHLLAPVTAIMNTALRGGVLALLVLPGAAASLLRPAPLGWRIALALPMILLPSLLALDWLEWHQKRTAVGLGATRLDRLRWLWLPQLGPGLAASLLLGACFVFALRIMH